jgi:uncharacterized protein (TIGR00725 family)
MKSPKRRQIAVLGGSKIICTPKAYKLAYEVGKEIAKRGMITLTGGGGGVMEAALKGAKASGGLTLAIIPWGDTSKVNEYADVVVATGMMWSRDSINLNSCDGAILVGGGAGTVNEASYGYILDKPMVALKSSGGMAEQLAGHYFDKRHTEEVIAVHTPKEAVEKLLAIIKHREHEPKQSARRKAKFKLM